MAGRHRFEASRIDEWESRDGSRTNGADGRDDAPHRNGASAGPIDAASAARPTGLEAPPSDFGFDALLAIARRRWMALALATTAGVALAMTYYNHAPAVYESTAQILVMRKDPRIATSGIQSGGEAESKVSEDMLATHMQIVQSKRLIGAVIESERLDELPSVARELTPRKSAADYLIDNLYVTRGGAGSSKTAHVLNIAFRHTSEHDTQRVVQAIVERYQAFLADKFRDVNKEAAQLIAKAQDELAADLEETENEYQSFRLTAPLLWKGDESSNIHRVRFEQVQSELGQLQMQETEARSRLEVVEDTLKVYEKKGATDLERLALIDEKNATRVGVLIAADRGDAQTAAFQAHQPARMATATAEYDAMIKLMLHEKTMSETFGPQHPEVANTRQQISIMQDYLKKKGASLGFTSQEQLFAPKKLVDAYVKLLRHDLVSLQKRTKDLQRLSGEEEEAAKSLVSYEIQGEALRKQVERKQELYNTVVDRLREINLAGDYGGFVNEVIAEPESGRQVAPKLLTCLLLGLLAGGGVGVAIAAGREHRDRSFHHPDEVQSALDLPLLCEVPSLNIRGKRRRQLARAVSASGSQIDPTVLAFHCPKSREAELFRGVRTQMFFNAHGRNGRGRSVILCTSANQGDGKSTMIANLATSIAQSGRRVLLIDCDMRRPRLHDLFGLEMHAGLSTVLRRPAPNRTTATQVAESLDAALDATTAAPPSPNSSLTPDDAMWDAVQTTEVDNLWALAAGPLPDNPAELLASGRFAQLLERARERFDYVLLDSPPVLAVADPCIVGSLADIVVLTVRISRDSRPETLLAKRLLADVDAPLEGVIVNGWDAPGGYGRGAYAYGYAYGGGDERNGGYFAAETPEVEEPSPSAVQQA